MINQHDENRHPEFEFNINREKVRIDSEDIELVIAMGNYSKLHMVDGSRNILYKSLLDMEKLLPSDLFMRVHRSFLVNKSKIVARKGEFLVLTTHKKSISIGKKYKQTVFGET